MRNVYIWYRSAMCVGCSLSVPYGTSNARRSGRPAHIKRVLDERASHRAPATRFRDELEDSMPEEQAENTLRALISWARYAEVFAYDEDAGVFSLENPS